MVGKSFWGGEIRLTNGELVHAAMAALESDDPKCAAPYFTEDFVWQGNFPRPLDKQRFMQLMIALKKGFPDYALSVKCCQDSGNPVVRAVMEPVGTHSGTFALPGLPPIKATGVVVALPRQAMEFTLRGSQINKIKLEHASGGGVMGLLEILGVELTEEMLEKVLR